MHSGMKRLLRLLGVLVLAVATLTACTKGETIEKDFLEKAKKGDTEAQFQLSRMYFESNGVDHSDKKGEHWVRLAADGGHAEAQCDLGGLYENGIAVRKNIVEADKWYILASRQGYGPGTRFMKVLEQKMTPEQIAQAKAKADEWKPRKN